MDTMAEIRKLFLDGKTGLEIIQAGYSKSTVYAVRRKLIDKQMAAPGLGEDDLVDLRRQRDRRKLELEIAELESKAQKMPERIVALEGRVDFVHELVRDVGDTLAYLAYLGWGHPGDGEEVAKEKAKDWVMRFVEKPRPGT